jgi:hypothetical protein
MAPGAEHSPSAGQAEASQPKSYQVEDVDMDLAQAAMAATSITPHVTVSSHQHVHPLLDNPKYMFINLRTSTGGRFLLRARETDTVERLKVKIAARLNISVKQQCLLRNGEELKDHMVVSECGLNETASLMLTVRLLSGPLLQSTAPAAVSTMEPAAAVVESVAAHLSNPNVQQAIARGEEISFVTRMQGRYMMVRMNNKGPSQCACGECNTSPQQDQEAPPSTTAADEHSERDATIKSLKNQHDNARLRDRISEIRARLQERSKTRQQPQHESPAASTEPGSTMADALTASRMSSASSVASSDAADGTSNKSSDFAGKTRATKRSRRCQACPAKLGLVNFACKCGLVFCTSHRQPSAHECSFDYQSSSQ